jgi:4-amino-4-deoxy-L-arabinose transferase-like glycosyltransferase
MRRPLALLFLLALAVRAGIGLMANGNGEMEGLAPGYEESALALSAGYGFVKHSETGPAEVDLLKVADRLAARGERLTPANAPRITPSRWPPANLHPPGYALVLLFLYRTLGPPMSLWARILQAIVDAASCLLVFAIGRRLAGPRAGWFAAIGTAIFPPVAYLATSRVADAWTPGLFILVIWCFLRALDTRALGYWAAAGLATGALWMFRPDYALLPAFLVVAALIVERDRGPVLRGAVALGLATLLVMLPWGLRNIRTQGHFTLGTTAAGTTLLLSVGQFPNPYGIGVADEWYAHEAQRHGYDGLDDPRADRMFKARYFEIARRNPGLIAGDALRRLAIALAPPYHWGIRNDFYFDHSVYEYLRHEGLGPLATLRRHPLEIARAYWDRVLLLPVALLLSVACLAFAVRERREWRTALLVLLPWGYVILPHLFFYMTTRMMVPAVFAQLIALGALLEGRRQAPAVDSQRAQA